MSLLEEKNFYPFEISDFQRRPPFSNLLPGIAGPYGIPMWIFYVNRGQAISSFGIADKDHPIMEFQPANKAYQSTPLLGFRTFIKKLGEQESEVYEPFNISSAESQKNMWIDLNELRIQDESSTNQVRTNIIYTNLTNEPVGGLIRRMEITNIGCQPSEFEIADGLPAIIPYGLNNSALKETSRTMEAWFEIRNPESNMPFFQLRSTITDSSEIHSIEEGNFSCAAASQSGKKLDLHTIVSPELIFGDDSSLQTAMRFKTTGLDEIYRLQNRKYTAGKTPCSFFAFKTILQPGETVTLFSLYGSAGSLAMLKKLSSSFSSPEYFVEKMDKARSLVHELLKPITTKTSSPEFDQYCLQTFLDNILRGGWPVQLGSKEKPVMYYIYSRKHGDPERDYNSFYLAPEFYSQGDGNFRDVNQNRRNDVWFEPFVLDNNIRSFMGLIQTDGYNPLIVKGTNFRIPKEHLNKLLDRVCEPRLLVAFLQKPFTPGSLLTMLEEQHIELHMPKRDFLRLALTLGEQCFDAEFGEGYWTDHWTYTLDLIDSYLAIYPDKIQALFDKNADIPFYESPVYVRPRDQKYVLTGDHPRQYHALAKDQEKLALIAGRSENQHFMHDKNGQGDVFRTTLRVKLIILAVIKFTTMDPYGMGIEMEADRPGWCDALNGLPGLFGSSFPETLELYRLLNLLIDSMPQGLILSVPIEISGLMEKVDSALENFGAGLSGDRDFCYWDAVSSAREEYRDETRLGFEGACRAVQSQELMKSLVLYRKKVRDGIDSAIRHNDGIPPTYFTYAVDRFAIIHTESGKPLTDENNHPYIRALGFRQSVLPLFLEAPARWMKQLKDPEARIIYSKIRESRLFDHSLFMYKTNDSLSELSFEIGRLRVFSPGWLENESIFLHMEYKYLLSVLKAGLYEEFFEDMKNALPAFQNPQRYGRNPMENSSFIVSSAHPDSELHGRGFVARLTGSTAEFLSMWNHMMFGEAPFYVQENSLHLCFKPTLPGWLFDDRGEISCVFLGQCTVVYHNPSRRNTFDEPNHISRQILTIDGETVQLDSETIPSPYAAWLREGRIHRIDVFFMC